MQAAGIHTPLVIDAPDWGQSRTSLQEAADLRYPLIVGEFSKYGGYPCGQPDVGGDPWRRGVPPGGGPPYWLTSRYSSSGMCRRLMETLLLAIHQLAADAQEFSGLIHTLAADVGLPHTNAAGGFVEVEDDDIRAVGH
jgi:hypothetical protein